MSAKPSGFLWINCPSPTGSYGRVLHAVHANSEWAVFINTRGVCSWQESRETMQGALPGGGQPAAETTSRRVSPRLGGEPPPPAAGPTPPLHAAAHGQHLHSLSQGGPGQSPSPVCSLLAVRCNQKLTASAPLFDRCCSVWPRSTTSWFMMKLGIVCNPSYRLNR